ncbi:F-actin-capping protein subunit alpha [Phytophthora boehmeriae]|uniref:F-actin-capping protein subunit alpha n=1 Tax=Phytophthora boehmeriae TaxID=109152 RepID=A0A8T1V432_9STRA|nr:F-actin-capping protein subunit alpha [Phytophthora boehmeriae]
MSEATKPLQSALDALSARLARVEAQLGVEGAPSPAAAAASPAAAPSAAPVELSPQLEAYDEYVAQYLPPFLSACNKLGDDTRKLGEVTEKAFAAQRAYLLMASQCKKPAALNPEHLKDLQACIKEINTLRDNRSEFANHQNMVNEGIQALGWLCVEPAPKPFIESYVGGSDFWGNKIRVQFKTSNPDQIAFVTSFKSLLTELMAYGGDVASYTPVAPAAAAAKPAVATASGGGMTNVFAGIKSIDQSSGKTAGLKTVTKDMQTWRKDYKPDGAAPAPAAAAPKKATAPTKLSKPAVCEERNGNWQIEHQTGPEPLTVSGINMRQQVYIYGCEGATILLEGKAKNIVFDSCKKTKLIFDRAVSSIEIVNCKGVQVQCKGVVPSVAIDKTDGCLVYISWEGRDVQFVTSKSSEMNVAFPEGADSDNYVEKPIPEQFVHKIMDDLSISSDVSDLYSH